MTKLLINSKEINLTKLASQILDIRNVNKTIVLVTGVFDLLHQGHQRFLELAKEQGEVLIVGLESDERVKQMKGNDRPHDTLARRLKKVSSLSSVDYVLALPAKFDSIEREQLIATIKPEILAVSAHTKHLDVKKKIVEKYGGKLVVVMQEDSRYSTSKILLRQQSGKLSAD